MGMATKKYTVTLPEELAEEIRWAWAMSRIGVEPVTRDVADKAIGLLRETGLHGHKYAVDAALAVVAGQLGGNVVLYTSDEDDMTKLCGEAVRVVAL
jgi:hypothetical protein